MSNHVEDRLWFGKTEKEFAEIVEMLPKENYDLADTIQRIRYRLAEIDQSILMGHDIGSDKKEVDKLINAL